MVDGFIPWGNKIKCTFPNLRIVLPIKNHRDLLKHSEIGHESTRTGASGGMHNQL